MTLFMLNSEAVLQKSHCVSQLKFTWHYTQQKVFLFIFPSIEDSGGTGSLNIQGFRGLISI